MKNAKCTMPNTKSILHFGRCGDSILHFAFVFFIATSANLVKAEVAIHLRHEPKPHVAVEGLPPETLAALARESRDHAAWQRFFTLHVMTETGPSSTPVLGTYKVARGGIEFTPRFPLRPGLQYHALFDVSGIPGASPTRVEAELLIPAPPPGEPTVVLAVYPSADVLPENLLKFYIHFSAPMQRGGSYRHIRLLGGNGEPVDMPFLELAEELWDRTGTRLTLLLDPGRVKQDLKPHKEVGRALARGHDYIVSIAADWRDAQGNPLQSEFRKQFRVTAPDVTQPDPHRWRLSVPSEGTRQPLVVAFPEPLDQAMLQHVIRVAGPGDAAVDGDFTVGEREMEWSIRPTTPWRSGTYQLVIEETLEDLAGNSVERPFEVYLPTSRPAKNKASVIPFQIGKSTDHAAASSE
jgi:hypothetical protein